MSNVIRFYEKKDPYYEFSNFYLSPFQCDGKTWLTSEHYFQANKFTHCPIYYQYILECDSPLKVFSMARQKQMAGYHSKCVVNKKTNPRLVNDVIAEFRNIRFFACLKIADCKFMVPFCDRIFVQIYQCAIIGL